MNNKEMLLRATAAIAAGRLGDFLAFCAPDVTMRWPGTPVSWTGHDVIEENMTPVLAKGRPWTFEILDFIVEGDCGIGHGSMTMRNPDGSTELYHFCDVYRVRDGKIIEVISYMTVPQTQPATT